MTRLICWKALAYAVILESGRRKDIYVAAILAALMIGAAAVLGRFGVSGLEMFLKDVALTVVNILSAILAILFAGRQLPEEVSRRTIYPLLARPISRFDLLLGKFLGAYAISLLALLLFTGIAVGALWIFHLPLGAIFWQYLLLRAVALGLLCALTITLSLFLTPAATVTIALLLAIGASTFSQAVLLLDGTAQGLGQWVLRGAYFVIPQLDLFDLAKKVSYGWAPVAGWSIMFLVGYGIAHAVVTLAVGVARFQRQTL